MGWGRSIIAFAASVLICIGIYVFLGRTEIGLQMRAVANDRALSALLGIPILRVETIARAVLPFLAVEFLVILLITYFPAISLALPRLFGFVH